MRGKENSRMMARPNSPWRQEVISSTPGTTARLPSASASIRQEKKMRRFVGLFVVVSVLSFAYGASAQKSLPLKRLQTVPLPDVKEGDFDHFTVDLAGKRLFLTAEDNNTVEVFDTGTNKLIRTLH